MRLPSSRTSLCLWLPTFELRLELVRTPELDSTSVALLHPGTPGGRGEIWQVSERAAQSGVRPGMRVSQAISLCTSLTLLEPDPAHYRAATREILEVLEGVSPIVQPGEDGLPGRGGGSFAGSAAAGAGGTSSEGGVFHVGVDGWIAFMVLLGLRWTGSSTRCSRSSPLPSWPPFGPGGLRGSSGPG